ncbi:AMP-binding protein [Parasphingopyxis algicola]|uniref:class I adenylate-forming enzyme family protein n=1 Tax=Parasphingopyxis algicola TaxID=2026624 RepID=UPI0015A0AF9D|nr:AMP-binding protein [Parasphingopyxis algicola]QLC23962.1 AMP-binding protein [Parasphingopyxis algicola]
MYTVNLERSYFDAQTDTPFRPTTFAALLEKQATERGNATALRELLADGEIGREWTYAELRRDAEKLGRALASRHQRGARIAIFAHNLPEWILMELAAGLAGITMVTVNPAFNARELTYVLEQSGAEAVYFVPSVRGNSLAPVVDAACAELPQVERRILLTDHDVLFDGHDRGELRETTPEDVVQIQYTSGTTGFPKGALLHQKGLIQNGADIFHRWNGQPGESVVLAVPLFHTAGCAIIVCGGLSSGVTILLAPGFDPQMIVRVIERERPALAGGVPTMLFGMIEAAEQTGCDVTSVKALMCGGAMVAPELARQARETFDAPIQIVYGQTESSPGITYGWADDSQEDLTGTIGQPLPHMDVAILDPADNSVCAIGEQGEICVRGYNVMAGYNDNPEATAETIEAEGWLHTGDLGTMDERGYLKITGRVKEMIIRGGENLFPAEIENAMLEHPAIAEVAVVGVPDEKWGELVACFMRAAGSEKPEPEELKAFVRERLSPQKTPAYWIWVEEWPMTGSGKIQKFAMTEAFERGEYEALTA